MPRFATVSVAIVVCGSATTGFATAGGCGPIEVLGFELTLVASGLALLLEVEVPRLKFDSLLERH